MHLHIICKFLLSDQWFILDPFMHDFSILLLFVFFIFLFALFFDYFYCGNLFYQFFSGMTTVCMKELTPNFERSSCQLCSLHYCIQWTCFQSQTIEVCGQPVGLLLNWDHSWCHLFDVPLIFIRFVKIWNSRWTVFYATRNPC